MIHPHRSKEAFLALVDTWKGILVCDGYGVYTKWVNLRQHCLAHLIRDVKFLTTLPETSVPCWDLLRSTQAPPSGATSAC